MDAAAALTWIEEQTTHSRRPEDASLCAYLRDGRVLCMLANALSGSTEVRVRSPDRFRTYHALESVSLFLRWARDRVKIPDTAMFTSAQLIDEQDEAAVLACINALAVQFGAKKPTAITTSIVLEPTKLSPLKSNTTTSSSSDVVADSAAKPDSPPAKTLSQKQQWPPVASTPKPTEEPQPKIETSIPEQSQTPPAEQPKETSKPDSPSTAKTLSPKKQWPPVASTPRPAEEPQLKVETNTPVQSQTPPAEQPKETSKPDSPSAAKTPSPKKQWPPVVTTPKATEAPQSKIEGDPVKPPTPPPAVQPTDTAPVVAPTPSKSPEASSITSSKASPDSSPKTRSPKEPLKKSPSSSSSKLPSWPPKAPESTTSSSSPAEPPLSSSATTPPAPLVKRPSKLANFLASMPSSQSKTTLPSPSREERSESEETRAPANDSPAVEAENVTKDDIEDVAASPEPTPSTVDEIAPTFHRFHLSPSSPSSEDISVMISNLDASPFAFAWSVSRVVLVHKADDTPLFSPKWKLDSINGVDVHDDSAKSSFDAWHERFQALSAPYVCVFTPQL
ncbi:hypothetical protein LEN26_012541 [Aphanomyces euteiches]|nr:hypothetical protein LEN26_012541 [Aphanomyces euteiches]